MGKHRKRQTNKQRNATLNPSSSPLSPPPPPAASSDSAIVLTSDEEEEQPPQDQRRHRQQQQRQRQLQLQLQPPLPEEDDDDWARQRDAEQGIVDTSAGIEPDEQDKERGVTTTHSFAISNFHYSFHLSRP
ncbi:hypothetical protein BDB00DRAFT_875860 [Zychaea mexicana]|uniref:uncharacterized protein n=1 Tax=Zychaea mexicana TaxID=64656 RepID=UPI0022FF0F1D|nr:uncharacterized protein BDB00DRAFT_875860 [Zychaea mexicana]KAI9489893.1 hypothetical protein BDB00DRAFT_875860 [Zychaea mexicana]